MEHAKKNIVLVTTWFPPMVGVAVNRMAAFSKYLNHDSYSVRVLTIRHGSEPETETINSCQVERLENSYFLNLPEFNVSDSKWKHYLKVMWKLALLKVRKNVHGKWQKNVVNRLNELGKVDILISSFSPEAAHLAALKFKRQNPKTIWIADMRDEMSQNPTISVGTKKKYIEIENEINLNASAITTVSSPLIRLFRESTMNKVPHIVEIRNGFDHEMQVTAQLFNEKFTITYCGTFYGSHKPDLFFDALVALNNEKVLPEKWQLVFVGTPRNFNVPAVFEKNTQFNERVTQTKSLEFMLESDANLFMVGKSERVGVFTGKLFDYLSVKRPVLAIVNKQDVAAELLHESGLGYVASNDNVAEIKSELKRLIQAWKNKKPCQVNDGLIASLHRKYQVQKLNDLIEKLVHEKS